MKTSAVLRTQSKDAHSVSSALEVDNVELEGLRVRTRTENGAVVTEIESDGIKALIRALDDIICCQMVAEKTIG